jgi:hypothetical protein
VDALGVLLEVWDTPTVLVVGVEWDSTRKATVPPPARAATRTSRPSITGIRRQRRWASGWSSDGSRGSGSEWLSASGARLFSLRPRRERLLGEAFNAGAAAPAARSGTAAAAPAATAVSVRGGAG